MRLTPNQLITLLEIHRSGNVDAIQCGTTPTDLAFLEHNGLLAPWISGTTHRYPTAEGSRYIERCLGLASSGYGCFKTNEETTTILRRQEYLAGKLPIIHNYSSLHNYEQQVDELCELVLRLQRHLSEGGNIPMGFKAEAYK